MPRAWAMAASSATGCSTPVSLFAAMIDTSAVSGVRVFASAAGMDAARPGQPPGRCVTWTPCSRCNARRGLKTAGWSLTWVMIHADAALVMVSTLPRMARLLASDPPAVNTISLELGADQACELLAGLGQRAVETVRHRRGRWTDCRNESVRNKAAVSATRGSTGVVTL